MVFKMADKADDIVSLPPTIVLFWVVDNAVSLS